MAAETKKPWEIEREFSFFGYGFQLVLAYFGTLIGLFIFAIAMEHAASATDSPAWAVVTYFFCLLLAVALALAVSALAPTSNIEGRWVWVAPVGLVAVGVVLDLIGGHGSEIRQLFYVGSDEGEAGWVLVLVTLPAFGCCCYSAMMFWRRRQRERKGLLPDE
jgi:lysylphosphatidylglycerol synthetase-like protein (DUF2156 family)